MAGDPSDDDRSELLREALHRHIVSLRSEQDASRWDALPLSEAERLLEATAEWAPAEDWTDWADAQG